MNILTQRRSGPTSIVTARSPRKSGLKRMFYMAIALLAVSRIFTTKYKQYIFTDPSAPSFCFNCISSSIPIYIEIDNSSLPRVHYVNDDPRAYFAFPGGIPCFVEGSVTNRNSSGDGRCICKAGWWGDYCSFPREIAGDVNVNWKEIVPRLRPRRIVYAVPFNNEFLLTEVRLHELGDVVDVFLFGESNYSSHGDAKPQRLRNALADDSDEGFAKSFREKIVYVFLDHFDEKGYADGGVAEALMRNHISQFGLREQLTGLRPEDIFIISDADEIPMRQMLLFLKNHDGFPEPFGFTYYSNVYTYYWKRDSQLEIFAGCTVAMLRLVAEYKAFSVRDARHAMLDPRGETYPRLSTYKIVTQTTTVGDNGWIMGHGRPGEKTPTGWHCSSCLPPDGIKLKMLSAQNGDFPRWGDFPRKMNVTYIRDLIERGYWFDDVTRLIPCSNTGPHIPPYVLKNPARFEHLLNKSYYREKLQSQPDQT